MESDNLEQKVKQHNYGRMAGKAVRTLVFAGLVGAAAFTYGRFQEAKDNKAYNWQTRQQIKHQAVEGYAWKEEADPTFYLYREVLISNPETMTMQGQMVKVTQNDTIDAGPIYKGGKIGYTVEEKIENTWDNFKDGVKDDFNRFKEWGKGVYDRTFKKDRQEEEKR